MALNMENAGALVPGMNPNNKGEASMATVRIKVISPFYYNRVALKKDQEIEVSKAFSIDMITGGKAIEVKSEPPKPEPEKVNVLDEKPPDRGKKNHSAK
jgi:hypothetical protein